MYKIWVQNEYMRANEDVLSRKQVNVRGSWNAAAVTPTENQEKESAALYTHHPHQLLLLLLLQQQLCAQSEALCGLIYVEQRVGVSSWVCQVLPTPAAVHSSSLSKNQQCGWESTYLEPNQH